VVHASGARPGAHLDGAGLDPTPRRAQCGATLQALEETIMDVTRGARGEVVIRVDGVFDAKAAIRLSGWLAEVPTGDPLVLDFRDVRECQDFGLARVAADLAARDRLVVHGLTRHQERMFRYLGVTLRDEGGAGAEKAS
jgi:hypothetical protein